MSKLRIVIVECDGLDNVLQGDLFETVRDLLHSGDGSSKVVVAPRAATSSPAAPAPVAQEAPATTPAARPAPAPVPVQRAPLMGVRPAREIVEERRQRKQSAEAPAVDGETGGERRIKRQQGVASAVLAAFRNDMQAPLPQVARAAYGDANPDSMRKLKTTIHQLCSAGRMKRLGAGSYKVLEATA